MEALSTGLGRPAQRGDTGVRQARLRSDSTNIYEPVAVSTLTLVHKVRRFEPSVALITGNLLSQVGSPLCTNCTRQQRSDRLQIYCRSAGLAFGRCDRQPLYVFPDWIADCRPWESLMSQKLVLLEVRVVFLIPWPHYNQLT